jgi:hypothetical protein
MGESPGRAGGSCLAGQEFHPHFFKPEDFLCHKSRHMNFILSQLKSLHSLTSHFHLHLRLQSVLSPQVFRLKLCTHIFMYSNWKVNVYADVIRRTNEAEV